MRKKETEKRKDRGRRVHNAERKSEEEKKEKETFVSYISHIILLKIFKD